MRGGGLEGEGECQGLEAQVLPWDKDLTWNERAFGNGTEPILRALEHPTLRREFQRRLRQAQSRGRPQWSTPSAWCDSPLQVIDTIFTRAAVAELLTDLSRPILPIVEADRRRHT